MHTEMVDVNHNVSRSFGSGVCKDIFFYSINTFILEDTGSPSFHGL